MKKLYLVTGGTGHLGQHVVRLLLRNKDCSIRVLTLPGDRTPLPAGVERIYGDVCTASSLPPFFDTDGYDEVVLFHLAALITISSKANPKVWDVNVEGTRNVMNMAMNANIDRVVYVSTVHAIPEKPLPYVITEMASFSPDSVDGQYAKSKAAAAELVLQFAKDGLNVSIVHPSGILGPGDALKSNHLTRTIAAMASGRIPVSIAGGYDFVDVRDVAKGILQCETRGKAGECYILSGHYSTVSNLTKIISGYTGRRFLPLHIPKLLLRSAAVLGELFSRTFHRKPLFTPYSMATLQTNAFFSSKKAMRELGYRTRPFRRTIQNVLHSLGYGRKVKTTV
jgi:dihydroflavonol-4-reductase